MDTSLRVMISSTVQDLLPEREVADLAIRHFRFIRYRAECMPTLSRPSREVCKQMAEQCDLFILILGQRYGYIIPGLGKSVTHYEYEVARRCDPSKILVYVKAEPTREDRLEEFVRGVTDFNLGYFRRPEFNSTDQLYNYLLRDISVWVSERIMATTDSSVAFSDAQAHATIDMQYELVQQRRRLQSEHIVLSALVRVGALDQLSAILPHVDVPQDIESALKDLLSDDGKIRRRAIRNLSHYDSPVVISTLCGILDDPKSAVRREAIQALGDLRNEGSLLPLCLCLRDKAFGVRTAAAEALGKIHSPRAIPFLLSALMDRYGNKIIERRRRWLTPRPENQEFREAVRKALVGFGEAAIPGLLATLDSDDDWTRWHAAWGLGDIGNVDVMQPLLRRLEAETTSEGKCHIIEAIAELRSRDSATEMIRYFENTTEKEVKLRIMRLMGKFFNNSDKGVVSRFLHDRLNAEHSLLSPETSAIFQALEYCIREPDPWCSCEKRMGYLLPLLPKLLAAHDHEVSKNDTGLREKYYKSLLPYYKYVIIRIAEDSGLVRATQEERTRIDTISSVRKLVSSGKLKITPKQDEHL